MSARSGPEAAERRRTAPDIRGRKGAEPIVSLTAYNATTARLADRHCDFLLVGDSMEMVEYGQPSTLTATVERIAAHGRAVVSATAHALVVVDMPFGSYEASKQDAFRSAARLLAESGAGAVKLEGGVAIAKTVAFLSRRGIPVMGHVGLTPQAINVLGSFRSQGHDEAARAAILADAKAVEEAGAFAVVVEGVVEPLAAEITRALAIPTIGIGASAECDGQILVTEDMLGLTPRAPRFVRRYAELSDAMERAFGEYAADVRARRFPAAAETYKPRG